MEVVVFHVVPPEVIKKRKNGELENLTDTVMRRFLQVHKEFTPEYKVLKEEGTYPLELSVDDTHHALLSLRREKAVVALERYRPSSTRRSYLLMDKKGHALKSRSFTLTKTEEKNLGVGIVSLFEDTFAVEWYLSMMHEYTIPVSSKSS